MSELTALLELVSSSSHLAQSAGRMYLDHRELQRLTKIPTATGSSASISFKAVLFPTPPLVR